jgi:hypothetical protein
VLLQYIIQDNVCNRDFSYALGEFSDVECHYLVSVSGGLFEKTVFITMPGSVLDKKLGTHKYNRSHNSQQ